MTTAAPGNTVAPQRSPDAYSLQVVSPNGCTCSNCDLFIGFAINTGDNGFLDIYMEGSAAGWIAVGFSETPDMVGGWVGGWGDWITAVHAVYVPDSVANCQLGTMYSCNIRSMSATCWTKQKDLAESGISLF